MKRKLPSFAKLRQGGEFQLILSCSFAANCLARSGSLTLVAVMECDQAALQWGMAERPLILNDPFALARSSCLHAVRVARDVWIDEAKLQSFATKLDLEAVQDVMKGSMGENCDVMPDDFLDANDAVNFALVFSLLQFAAATAEITSLDLGYYLWRSGKTPGARQFPRHHTKNTIFYRREEVPSTKFAIRNASPSPVFAIETILQQRSVRQVR